MVLSASKARVVDPVTTTVARGYRNAAFVFSCLFPLATVETRGGKIIQFGAEDFAKMNLVRAPGSSRQRLNVGYSGEDYALTQRALDGTLPLERLQEASAAVGISLGNQTTKKTMSTVFAQIEFAAADLATKAGNYSATNKSTLAGASQWSHKDSKPAKAVKTAKEAIRKAVGMEPNVLAIGVEVFDVLTEHPDVIDRIKHVTGLDDGFVVGEKELAAYFSIDKVAVGRARSGKPGAFKNVWGKNAVLAYSGVSTLAQAEADMGEPSFGYTYRLRNYPQVSVPWFDNSCDSWIYPVTSEDTPVIAGKDAGYLFSAVVE